MRHCIVAGFAAAALVLAAPLASSFAETGAASPDQAASPGQAASPDQQEHWKQSGEQWRQRRQEIFDARLVGFKASLALTADQEKNWPVFEAVLRGLAQSRGEWRHHGDWGHREGAAADGGAPPSPVDVMRRMSERMGQRSAQLTALADATAPLYASLDDKQKLIFRVTLHDMSRVHRREHGHRHWQ
jgi:hypothetical protein